jgi:hypothetical protein
MDSMNDPVIYQAPGLKIYSENGRLIAEFINRAAIQAATTKEQTNKS